MAVALSAAGRVYGSHASSGGKYRCREGRRAGAIDGRVAVALSAAGRVYGSHASSGGECRCREGRRAGAADERVAVALSAAGRGNQPPPRVLVSLSFLLLLLL